MWPAWLAWAETLCQAVAGRDLEQTPLYIVPRSALPPGYSGDYHFGFTTPSLNLYLRDAIPSWCGGGPCMVIDDLGFADEFEPVDLEYVVPTSVLHELAHNLDRPAPSQIAPALIPTNCGLKAW